MRRVLMIALIAVLLLPGVARAGSATDAALALGAFAVFNQVISGTGVFAGVPTAVARPAPVYVAPPPPPVYVVPPPPLVVYRPAPVYYAPRPVYHAPRVIYVERDRHWHKHGYKHGHGHGHRHAGHWR